MGQSPVPNVRPPGATSQTAETIFGGSNSAGSNATLRIKLESCLKSRQNSTWVGQRERLLEHLCLMARRVEKLRDITHTSAKVIGAHTLRVKI